MSNAGNQAPPNVPMDDAALMRLVKTVEPEDFRRIDPPVQVWTGLLIGVRDIELSNPGSSRQADDALGADVVSLSDRMRPARLLRSSVFQAAAALLVVAGIGGLIFSQRDAGPEAVTVATAAMDDEGLPVATDSQAWASVVCEGDECRVDVEFTTVPEPGADALELWVIDTDVAEMHSLGLVTGSGSFPLPDDVNPEGFPIVDISVEPRDGVEAHSGQSVLRGIFETTA